MSVSIWSLNREAVEREFRAGFRAAAERYGKPLCTPDDAATRKLEENQAWTERKIKEER